MAVAQAGLAHAFARLGQQPPVVQTDHGACFLGAEGGASTAVPSRLTLWLWGLDIAHHLIPVRHPQSNGAVERLHGGLKLGWAGETGGIDAFLDVWNVDKPPLADDHRPYLGRTGFNWEQVWMHLSQVRVQRRVDRQGKCSLWNHAVRVGRQQRDRLVTLTFDGPRHLVVVRDEREVLLAEVALPWFTEDWLWADIPLTDQAAHAADSSTPT